MNATTHTPDAETRRIAKASIAAVDNGTVRDEEAAAFLFNGTANVLLVAIANGTLDARTIAKLALASRGLDDNGNWIGFDAAAKLHGITK